MGTAHPNSLWVGFLGVPYQLLENRKPQLIDPEVIAKKDNDIKQKQKANFDCRHGVHELPRLLPEQYVWIKDRQAGGTVVEQPAQRSYVVRNPEGEFRRNRRHLVTHPSEETPSADIEPECESTPQSQSDTDHTQSNTETSDSSHVRTRGGRISKPPQRFEPSWN